MSAKFLSWMRRHMKTARVAAVLSFVVLIVAIGVVQASGPMRPRPPMKPGGMGMWGHVRRVWYPMEPVPTMTITAVVKDESVTFETENFPEDEDFTVTMGQMYTRGINGIEVGTFNSGEGGSLEQTFDIPEDLQGEYRISIRAQTDHTFPYYAFNWFYNNSTEVEETAAEEAEVTEEAAAEEPEEAAAEEPEEAAAEEPEEAAAEEPEEAAAEEPEEAAAEEPEEAGTGEGASELTAQRWEWTAVSDPIQGDQEIETPENYWIEFSPEGGVSVQADCNSGTGSYTEEDGSLTVAVPAMTLAICPEGSIGDEFVNYLYAASSYSIADGVLTIEMAPDGGTLTFRAAEAAEMGTGGAEETGEAVEPAEGEEAAAEETEEPVEGEEAAAGEEMAEPASIAEIAAGDERFSTLVAALEAAGLAETLAAEGEYTVFAPVNEAFEALPEGQLETLLADPEGALTDILLYHVVLGVVPAETVVTLDSADTVQGEAVSISVVDDGVVLNDSVNVVETDIEGSNGIIHVIDGVLVPPSLSEAEAAEGEEAATEETEEAAAGAEAAEVEEAAEGEEATTEESEEAAAGAEAAEVEEAAEGEAAMAEGEGPGLVGGVWQWSEITDPVDGTTTVEDPSLYTVEFLDDGTVEVQADCNSGRGTYSVEDSSITISPLALTRALCAEGSLSDDFVMYLEMAAIFFFQDGNLYIDLPADSGTLMFVPANGDGTSSLFRGATMKVAAQNGDNGDDEEDEDAVPSFEICTVVKDETVAVVTADFPEDETFNVTMGPVLVAKPMKPSYGPMPMPKGDYMPAYPPMNEPYGMGPDMDSMYMGPPKGGMEMGWPKGGMDMGKGDMWGKPMPPKVYVPFYYEAGTFESGDGGTLEAEFEVPDELAGYYRIQIMLRTDHQYPYYAYNWFYNNDAAVCDENGEDNNNG